MLNICFATISSDHISQKLAKIDFENELIFKVRMISIVFHSLANVDLHVHVHMALDIILYVHLL